MQIIPLFSKKNGGVIGVGCAEVVSLREVVRLWRVGRDARRISAEN